MKVLSYTTGHQPMWRSFFKASVAYCAGFQGRPTSAHDIWQLDEDESLRYSSTESKQQHLAFRAFLRQKFATVDVASEERPRVFISYPWAVRGLPSYPEDKKNELVVERVASDLETAQFQVHLDKWEDRLQDGVLEFMKNMPESDHLLILGTPLYLQKYNREVSDEDENEHVVRFEADVIADLSMRNHLVKERVIPIVLAGSVPRSIPPLLQSKAKLHLTEGNDYHEKMLHLICDLRGLNYQERCQLEMAMRSYISQAAAETKDDGDLSLALEDRPRARRTLPRRSQTKAPPAPGVSHNLPPRNPYFTGREKLFSAIERALATNEGIGVISAQAISGMGGVGKSSLAQEHAHRQLRRPDCPYEHIRWMIMEDEESQLASWLQFARELGLDPQHLGESELIPAIYRRLGAKPFLLIFDNTEGFASIQRYLPKHPCRNQHILLTSRNLDDWHNPICVDLFTDEEAIEFAIKFFQSTSRSGGMDRASIGKLNQVLAGLPLALILALSYIREHHMTVEAFLDCFEKKGLEMLSTHPRMLQNVCIPNTIITLWQMTVERLRAQHPDSLRLLTFISLLSADDIPTELLRVLWGDEEKLQTALTPLIRDSLIRPNSDNSTLSVHRLLQTAIGWSELKIDRTTSSTYADVRHWASHLIPWLSLLIPSLTKAFPRTHGNLKDTSLIENLLPHCLYIMSRLDLASRQSLPDELSSQLTLWQGDLSYWAGRNLRALGQFENAMTCLKQALKLRKSSYGPKHRKVALAHQELSHLYNIQANYDEALAELEKALNIKCEALGRHHIETATTLHFLGCIYAKKGNYNKGITQHQEELKIKHLSLPASHPELARTYGSLAWIYVQQGRYSDAKKQLHDALDIYTQHQGKYQLIRSITHNNLGDVYCALGEYDKGLMHYHEALRFRQILLGEKHPEVAKTMGQIALAQLHLGEYEIAMTLLRKAEEGFQLILGKNHPDLAALLQSKGETLWHLNRFEEALEPLQNALAIMEERLGVLHPTVAETLDSLGKVYASLELTDLALEHHKRALTIRQGAFPEGHPRIIYTLVHLASVYLSRHELGHAREYVTLAETAATAYPEVKPIHDELAVIKAQLAELDQPQQWAP